jgi:hypothetical protein
MEAVHDTQPQVSFEIFTTVPHWFFAESLTTPFSYHRLLTDVGMVQRTPLEEDPIKTAERLDDFLPFDPSLMDRLAKQLKDLRCRGVICDIAPMGIVVAQHAGIPSVLVENFTWDWIYSAYLSRVPHMERHVDYLRSVFDAVQYHIQTEPVCEYRDNDLVTSPVCRTYKTHRNDMLGQLEVPLDKKVVLITMGGIETQFGFAQALRRQSEVSFIMLGGVQSIQVKDNAVLLPHHSGFYHPDLVHAADLVVGKLGYSTLAEVYHAGIPYAYVPRKLFRESEIMAHFVEHKMVGRAIEGAHFHRGDWVSMIPDLLGLERKFPESTNGSEQIAAYVSNLLEAGDL